MKNTSKKSTLQVKNRFYYIFWGTATVSVLLGQLYVGTGYRVMAESTLNFQDYLTRVLDTANPNTF
jgi:hypothetical protein